MQSPLFTSNFLARLLLLFVGVGLAAVSLPTSKPTIAEQAPEIVNPLRTQLTSAYGR
ncbi:MAG TPA: hypothetical protein IGS53_24380 [Leptolyngbyaceae cyanobacterium M33_DOE_097]|nr:hypothetical protein [Leptolyngbyaceae cyanobacterium M33_DOE_097]